MIPDTLQRLRLAIADLDIEVPHDLETVTDPAACATLLGVVRELRNELYTIEQYIEGKTAQRMTGPALEWDGGRAIRRQASEKTVWRNEDIASAVLVSAMVDENGELPSEEANIVACRVKAALVKCAGIDAPSFSSWRVGELKAANIDPAEYRTRTPGRFTVQVDLADDTEQVA